MKLSFENRPAYAFIAVSGPVGADDAASLRESARDRAARHETTRVLVDVREAELSRDARDTLLELARSPDAASAGLVTNDDLFVAEVNMASLAAGSRARAFTQSSDAHRWLSRGSIVKTPIDLPQGHPRLSDRPIDAAERRRALLEPPTRDKRTSTTRPIPRARPLEPLPPPAPSFGSERPTPAPSERPPPMNGPRKR